MSTINSTLSASSIIYGETYFFAICPHFTHPMSGIYKDVAKEAFNIPDTFDVHLAIAIGYKGDKEMLSSELQAREIPSGRRPLNEIVFEGSFK